MYALYLIYQGENNKPYKVAVQHCALNILYLNILNQECAHSIRAGERNFYTGTCCEILTKV